MSIDDYHIIRELGYGMIGTVYLAELAKKQYALKIEHVLNKDWETEIQREAEFHRKIASRFPDNFIQLVMYDVIRDCDHEQKYSMDPKLMNIEAQKKFQKLAASKLCMRKVYTLVDGSLDSIINGLNRIQLYSLIVQIANIINIMHSGKFIHGDFYSRNIGYRRSTSLKIPGIRNRIPSHGYTFVAIDYDLVRHPANQKDRQIMKFELRNFVYTFIKCDVWKYIRKNAIPMISIGRLYKKCAEHPEFRDIQSRVHSRHDQLVIFEAAHPEIYHRLLLGKYYKKFPTKILLPIDDLIEFANEAYDPIRVIRAFLPKLRT